MDVKTEKEVTGAAAKALREQYGLTQKAFWTPMGITQAGGCRYENGQAPVPRPIRILVFANYVAGLKVDASTEAGVASLMRLAKIQASETADQHEAVGAVVSEAMRALKKASRVLSRT